MLYLHKIFKLKNFSTFGRFWEYTTPSCCLNVHFIRRVKGKTYIYHLKTTKINICFRNPPFAAFFTLIYRKNFTITPLDRITVGKFQRSSARKSRALTKGETPIVQAKCRRNKMRERSAHATLMLIRTFESLSAVSFFGARKNSIVHRAHRYTHAGSQNTTQLRH
jgi:hypothetical protein